MAGSNPVMIVRVAATIEELRRNLAEGRAQIEVTAQGMQRMVTAFDGTRIVSQAHNITAAVHAIGGASQLTAAEQAKVNRTLEEALAKYAALGKEAPAGMRQLAADTKQADTASSGLSDTVRRLGTDLLAMFTARAAYNFVAKTIEEASALKDLSQQTHINVEDLQVLAGGMSEFGVDADELGKALYKLSRGIAGGDDSVASGLHLMGMSLKDVEGLNGKELFLKIENGLAALQGGLRDTAAADLFGGKLGAAMAGASEGIGDALAKWQQLNAVASTASVDAMDQFGESVARANKNLGAMSANMIGPLAEGFNILFTAAERGASKWDLALSLLPKGFAFVGTGAEGLTKILDDQNQKVEASAAATKTAAGAHAEAAVALTAQAAAQKFMASLELDAAKPLLAWQTEYLGHLKEIGALNAKNAAGIGVNVQQFKAYEEATKKATEAEKKRTELEAAGLLATTKLWDEYFALRTAHGGTANDQAIAQIDKWAADLTAQMVKAGTDTKEFYDALAATSHEKMAGVGIDWDVFRTKSIPALRELADNALRTYTEMIASGQFHRDELEKQRLKWEEARDAARGYGAEAVAAQDAAREATKHHTEELGKQREAADAAKAAMRALGGSAEYDLSTDEGMAAFQKANPGASIGVGKEYFKTHTLQQAIAAGLVDLYAAFKGLFGTTKLMGLQSGAENFPGGLAMVGERGPELVSLPRGANVYPTGTSAGGVSISVPIIVNGPMLGTQQQLASLVGEAVMKQLRDQGVRF